MPSNETDGYGDGSGSGYGSGYGYGYGSGDGSGDGIHIGDVGGYSAVLIAPWGYLRLGCELHSVAHWRTHWREIAERQNVAVSDSDAARILAATEVTP